MHLPIIQYYYSLLKPNSQEGDVDNMWNNILPLYFEARMNYGIEMQSRPWPGVTKTKSDFTIRYIKNGSPKAVILIEDKRVIFESSDAKWAEAVDQLTNYMTTARAAQYTTARSIKSMYAIVTVGRYSRFYELCPGEDTLRDYPNGNGQPYEFKRDEDAIDAFLLEFVQKTAH
ncbi:hypothetical protein F4809DRAFT_600259 [Biscogniauxia mediterranea]|nr:hypothetical protein F4809DRAFT_600259 [Biscogniauxia mediterranea]